jgi:hypothetical protein
MKTEEAIAKIEQQKLEFLENNIDYAGITEAYNMAVSALEKQEGKKPVNTRKLFADHLYIGYCPVCGDGSNSEFKYCCLCGQKLDWSV